MVIKRDASSGAIPVIDAKCIKPCQVVRCTAGSFFVVSAVDHANWIWAIGLPTEGEEQFVFLSFQPAEKVELIEDVKSSLLESALTYRACRDGDAEEIEDLDDLEPVICAASQAWAEDF